MKLDRLREGLPLLEELESIENQLSGLRKMQGRQMQDDYCRMTLQERTRSMVVELGEKERAQLLASLEKILEKGKKDLEKRIRKL